MEVIENKSKYEKQETRWRRFLRILRKFIWIFPLLAIAFGLAIGWFMIQRIQAESPQLPEVRYERYLTPQERAKQKELKKLELYRDKMKKEKQEQFSSRYERIISGSDLIGKADFGKIITPEEPAAENIPAEAADSIGKEELPQQPDEPAVKARKTVPVPGSRSANSEKKTPPKTELPAMAEDTVVLADSLEKPAPDPFHTLRASHAAASPFTRAHFYGDQDILSGSYVRLRLGEDMLVNGIRISRNTIFRGVATLSRNKIEISIEQIGLQEVAGIICDQDYNPGIVLPASRSGDMEQALNRSVYQQGTGTAMDLPYEILQDISQNIIRNKRRKQSTIRINDGYPVYITLTRP